jgi:dipeptidyl aminopeptidase/acylaminoacyl peptidase
MQDVAAVSDWLAAQPWVDKDRMGAMGWSWGGYAMMWLAGTQSLSFFTDLQKMGVPSRLVVFENSSHWPEWYDMVLYYAAHLDWFHTYLGGAPSPWDPKALERNAVFGEKDEKAKP